MSEFFCRSEVLLGEEVMSELRRVRVILFGVGGVGEYDIRPHQTLARGRVAHCPRQRHALRHQQGGAKHHHCR